MDKISRISKLLEKDEVDPVRIEKVYFADSKLLEVEHYLQLSSENFLAEEIATQRFLLNTLYSTTMNPKDSVAIIYPINLAIIASKFLPGYAAALAYAEIKLLQSYKKPIIYLSIFDFCLSPIKRTTKFEKKIAKSIRSQLPVNRLKLIRNKDRIVQFESTVDLVKNCTIFPLINTLNTCPKVTRQWMYSFVGNTTKKHWRKGMVRSPEKQLVWNKLATNSIDTSFIGSKNQAKRYVEGNPYFEVPAKSVFTLCPRGIGNWTFRLFESIAAGSIPVILSDSYLPPMPELNWSKFSLQLPESELARIPKILNTLSETKIRQYQIELSAVQHRFTPTGLQSLWKNWLETEFL